MSWTIALPICVFVYHCDNTCGGGAHGKDRLSAPNTAVTLTACVLHKRGFARITQNVRPTRLHALPDVSVDHELGARLQSRVALAVVYDARLQSRAHLLLRDEPDADRQRSARLARFEHFQLQQTGPECLQSMRHRAWSVYFRGLAAAAPSVALSARALPALCQFMFQADSSKVAATEAMRAPIASGPPRLGFSPPGRGAFRPRRGALVSPRRPLLRKGSLGFRARGGPAILTSKGDANDLTLPLSTCYLVFHAAQHLASASAGIKMHPASNHALDMVRWLHALLHLCPLSPCLFGSPVRDSFSRVNQKRELSYAPPAGLEAFALRTRLVRMSSGWRE